MSKKIALTDKKRDFKSQYFTLRTIRKLGDLSVQNVLNIWPNLRLCVLTNSVLKKRIYFLMCARSRLKYFLNKFIFSATFPSLASFLISFLILVQSHPQLLLKQLKTERNKHQNFIKFCLIWLIIILNLYHLYRIYMKT